MNIDIRKFDTESFRSDTRLIEPWSFFDQRSESPTDIRVKWHMFEKAAMRKGAKETDAFIKTYRLFGLLQSLLRDTFMPPDVRNSFLVYSNDSTKNILIHSCFWLDMGNDRKRKIMDIIVTEHRFCEYNVFHSDIDQFFAMHPPKLKYHSSRFDDSMNAVCNGLLRQMLKVAKLNGGKVVAERKTKANVAPNNVVLLLPNKIPYALAANITFFEAAIKETHPIESPAEEMVVPVKRKTVKKPTAVAKKPTTPVKRKKVK